MIPSQLKFLTNRFVIAIIIFLVWIAFIDDNSLLYLGKLNKKINELQTKKAYYQKEITVQKQTLNDLNDDEKLQKYAREKLLMKKEGETIYLIDEPDNN